MNAQYKSVLACLAVTPKDNPKNPNKLLTRGLRKKEKRERERERERKRERETESGTDERKYFLGGGGGKSCRCEVGELNFHCNMCVCGCTRRENIKR